MPNHSQRWVILNMKTVNKILNSMSSIVFRNFNSSINLIVVFCEKNLKVVDWLKYKS